MDSKKKQQLIDFGKGWVERNTISVEVNEDRGNYRVGINWGDDYYLYEDKQEMEAWLKSLKNRIGG